MFIHVLNMLGRNVQSRMSEHTPNNFWMSYIFAHQQAASRHHMVDNQQHPLNKTMPNHEYPPEV